MCQKIRTLQTVLEAKRKEFVDDALIYAISLCEELEISFEPPRRIRRKHIFGGGMILSMDELNLDQTPQDINKEEFQLERDKSSRATVTTQPCRRLALPVLGLTSLQCTNVLKKNSMNHNFVAYLDFL
ncbi:UNVERIFIED_CONTAM: hypothetical protein NCL1_22955 [Trichonephila clavipes]